MHSRVQSVILLFLVIILIDFSVLVYPSVASEDRLSKSLGTKLGTEPENENNWITANHDSLGTRSSNQTAIGKDNVDKLHVKWLFLDRHRIENSPLVIGSRLYVQDNAGGIFAFDANTGLNLWKIFTGSWGLMHGMTYDQGVLFATTGHNATVIAVNATNGKIIWQSAALGSPRLGFSVGTPPIVWKDYVVVGSANSGNSSINYRGVLGNITAVNRTNGEKLWNLSTAVGYWVSSEKSPPNGGATAWSGGSLDSKTGLLYIPIGNARPEYNATTRQTPNLYVNHMIAVNISNGNLVWATPFIAEGTVFSDVKKIPDTHDWDTSWGSSISILKYDNGTSRKVVVGHDKMGHVMAMDAATGEEIWWKTIGTTHRTYEMPRPNGSGEVWPGPQYGIEAYSAVDNDTVYVASSSMGFNYFTDRKLGGNAVPIFDSIDNGVGNGTITAINMKTGNIKWQYPTSFPTKVSPLVTNGVVFSGYFTSVGKPYTVDHYGNPAITPLESSGIVLALDKDTGEKLWEFNVGAPIGVGGPSIGNGMLFVPIDRIHPPAEAGAIVAFKPIPAPERETKEGQLS